MNNWKQIVIPIFAILQIFLLWSVYTLSYRVNDIKAEIEIPVIPEHARYTIEDEIGTTTITVATTSEVVEEESLVTENSLFTLFTDLLASISPIGTESLDTPVSITGDTVADDVIYTLAEDAGYIRQPVATTTLFAIEGKMVQKEVREHWLTLQNAALVDGIRLGIVSGYRSPEAQRSLFLKYFRDETKREGRKDFTAKEIKAGIADTVIMRTLVYAAPPGYSRHHTGYTIDIRDVNSGFSFYEFGKTNGYKWISRNNYENARLYGFIPSYPRGERDGGPEPEPWEFVWIGEENMKNLSSELLGTTPVTTRSQ